MRAATTPSSLKWLIDRRARLAGELTRAAKLEAERTAVIEIEINNASDAYMRLIDQNEMDVAQYEKFVAITRHALAATDLLLSEHRIPIDPVLIADIRPHRNPRKTDYNQMTRLIFECLRKAKGQNRSTTEVAAYVAVRCAPDLAPDEFADFKYAIRKRLGHLVWEGRLDRAHLAKTSVEGRWKLLNEGDDPSKP